MDKLALKNSKLELKHGKFRLWSYTNERTNKTSYAATVGLETITHTDFLLFHKIDAENGRVLYDKPELFNEVFKASVNNFGHLNNLFQNAEAK